MGHVVPSQSWIVVDPVTPLGGFPGYEDMLIGPTDAPLAVNFKAKKAPPAKTSVRAPAAAIASNERFIWSLPPPMSTNRQPARSVVWEQQQRASRNLPVGGGQSAGISETSHQWGKYSAAEPLVKS
jgi:hypothetical protein